MPLFQQTVINKYLSSQDKTALWESWLRYKRHFLNPAIQENIRNSKEEQYQGEFLIDLFVNVLGYTKNPAPNFNLTTELKNVKDSKKADGAILLPPPSGKEGLEPTAIAVIELKGTNTIDLGKIETQAFGYKNNQPDCVYVITSNFEKLRFYIDNAIEHIEFNLFKLTDKEFEVLYLCLAYQNIKNGIPKKLKEESLSQEDIITKKLYKDYSQFKRELYQNMTELNPQYPPLELFQKSQKLLDRFLFLFFAEDRLLLAPNSVRTILSQWTQLKEMDNYEPLYARFKKFFNYLNTGYQSKHFSVFPYNGGLFQADEILDTIQIEDSLLYHHTLKISEYDFASEVDVTILGHIFENSLNELDEVKAQLEGTAIDKTQTKRKKDGVFYTPKYITKHIVENTVGKLCQEKKEELAITDETTTAENLNAYKTWLLQLTICDPACGSGAFLNEALNFLINEHDYIKALENKLLGSEQSEETPKESELFGAALSPMIENSILENNLFGVDLNEESVEIARLSLWLRTAKPNRKLNDLSNNIKCGNSLIDDPEIAGEKAFDWQKEFPQIFKRTNLSGLEDLTGFEKGGFDVVIGNPPYVQLQNLKDESEKLAKMGFETFEKTGDLYCLFYEKGNQILKENGLLGYITSNKWMRANYGKSLRKYLTEHTQPLLLTDLGNGIFESATVDSNILIFSKKKLATIDVFPALDLSQEKSFTDFTVYENRKKAIKPKGEEAWIIANALELQIKDKIESIGTPLKDWEIEIYRGILTGLNEAFMIDLDTKNELLRKDPKSAELIKPLLRGRDIQRYYSNFAKVWLIATFPVLHIDIDQYPAIRDYLASLGKKLEQSGEKGSRKKTNNKWFETQDAIAYYAEFEKDSIIWKRIGSILRFSYCKEYYGLDSTCILTGEGVKYLLCVLNSKMGHYLLQSAPKTGTGDLLISVQAIEPLQIPKLNASAQEPFNEKADLMIALNKDLQTLSQKFQRNIQREFSLEKLNTKLENWYLLSFADFLKELEKQKAKITLSKKSEWEEYFAQTKVHATEIALQISQTDREIDMMVYALYELSPEEIAIIEK